MKLKREQFDVLRKGQKQKGASGSTMKGVSAIDSESGEESSDGSSDSSSGDSIEETMKNGGIGATLSPEESEALQRALGIPVETASEEDAEKYKREAKAAIQEEIKSNRKSIGGGGDGSLLVKAIARLTQPKVDWKAALKKYIGELMGSSETVMPSRRHLYKDEYMHSDKWKFDALDKIAIAVDVTGSVMGDFHEFLAEVAGIAHAKKIKEIHVLPFAESVHDVVVIKGKKPEPSDFEKVRLGGGTENITAIKDYIKKVLHDRVPFCVIITDGYLTTGLPTPPKAAWGKNTIWMIYGNPAFEQTYNFPKSWGKTIHVNFAKK